MAQPQYITEGPPETPRSLWRNRDFLLLWSGQIVSNVGSQVSLLAFPLLVLTVSHSPAEAGLLSAVRGLPFIVLSLVAGALLDRWDRKLTMILCDAGRAVALGTIPIALATGHLTFLQLAVVAGVEGALFTFFTVAETAALPQVVAAEQIPDAVGLNWAIDSVSTLTGPSLSGLLYAAGRSLPFLADAVTYALSVVSLLFIRSEFQEERPERTGSLWSEIHEGLTWLWGEPSVRSLALLIGGLNLFSMGYPIIMIVRAQELHAGPVVIGLLFATGGIGSIGGSLLVGPLQRRFSVGSIMVVGAWLWALTWPPYALAPNIVTFGIANAVGWLVIPPVMGTQYSYRLQLIPDRLQGRVQSVFKLLAFGPQPLALALTGALAQAYGAVPAIYLLTIPQVLLCIAISFNRPLRKAPKLSEVVTREG